VKYLLIKIKLLINLLRYRGIFLKKQYSKNKEDQYLKKVFGKKTNGIYLDVGAFHPYRFSNTYLLYRKGWSGINVDINKESIDLFNIARPQDVNLNIAIGDKNQKQIFYYKKKRHPMNTLNKEFAKRFFNNKGDIKKSKIMTRTFDYLVGKVKKIDLLDIDVEGNEYSVVKKINFNKIKFNVILIELTKFNKQTKASTQKIHRLLLSKNYKYIKSLGETSVYKNKLF
jgi:FkbM family methyltransferase|tara:strand:+ start:141 stop:821 length:681 start_codon:yes stop_codon:yes gene_type:complete